MVNRANIIRDTCDVRQADQNKKEEVSMHGSGDGSNCPCSRQFHRSCTLARGRSFIDLRHVTWFLLSDLMGLGLYEKSVFRCLASLGDVGRCEM